jgi:hypothetical protein
MKVQEKFEQRLVEKFKDAAQQGLPYLTVKAGDLHREVGNYPGDHRLPSCCNAMYALKEEGDNIEEEPLKGKGANLIIRYKIPRSSQNWELKNLKDMECLPASESPTMVKTLNHRTRQWKLWAKQEADPERLIFGSFTDLRCFGIYRCQLLAKTAGDKKSFWEDLSRRYRQLRLSGGNTGDTRRYWLELYWPSSKPRDPQELYMYFHEKKKSKNQVVKDGDRVLFYEVLKHPDHKDYKGSQTLFASGTVLSETEDIPESKRGKKRWLLQRKVHPEYYVPLEKGISLEETKRMLGLSKYGARAGFEISDPAKFFMVEKELCKRMEILNLDNPANPSVVSSFHKKTSSPFQLSGDKRDERAWLDALEESSKAHKNLLNKLYDHLKNRGCELHDNKKIDLHADIAGVPWIFEVKSAREENFSSQIRSAVAQLYEYRFHYFPSGASELCLVIQIRPPEGLGWTVKYLKTLGIHLCWPVPDGFQAADASLRLFD